MSGRAVVLCLSSIALGYFFGARRHKKIPRKVVNPFAKLGGVCIVTGGSRGIGAAVCKKLAKKYKIACVYRSNKSAADEVVNTVRHLGGEARAFQCDVGNPAEVEKMFKSVDRAFPDSSLVALVNNAAIIGPVGNGGKLLGLPSLGENGLENEVWKVLKPNVLGPLACCRLALERMSPKLNSKGFGGQIVNISSGAAYIQGAPLLYMISKGALNSMQCGLVQECALHSVRINSISPGMCDTDMPSEKAKEKTKPSIPMKRLGEASEIADTVEYLLGNKSSYVCGANIRVAGGRPMGSIQ